MIVKKTCMACGHVHERVVPDAPQGFFIKRNESDMRVGNSPDWYAYPAPDEMDEAMQLDMHKKGFEFYRLASRVNAKDETK